VTPGARAVRLAAPVLLGAVLVGRLGTEPFLRAGGVLSGVPIGAALLLGLVATTAQALRWRTVATAGADSAASAADAPDRADAAPELTVVAAVAECYRAAFLNIALPGGLAGDAVRVWRRAGRTGPPLRSAAGSVAVERLCGTAVLALGAALAALTVDLRLAAGLLLVAGAAAAVAVPGCARLPPAARGAVLGWSVLVVAALLALFAVTAHRLGTLSGAVDVTTLGLLLLAGGSIPLGLAGFGPREGMAALGFAAAGLPASSGVTTAAAFGVLAVVSVLPGGLILLSGSRPARRPARQPAGSTARQVELDAHVLAHVEPPRGGPQRVAEPVRASEPQPGNPVTDQ